MGSDEDEPLRAGFARWLAARRPHWEGLEVGALELPKSGFSAKTVFAPVRYRQAGREVREKLVLRIENPEPAIYPRQAPALDVEIEIQFRAMEALHRTGQLPLAPLVGLERDASVLGQPFFVMGFVEGDVLVENPPYPASGPFVDATPEIRERMILGGLERLATIHALDWRASGFDWLVPEGETPSLRRQIELWEAMARRELGDRVHPDLDRGFRLLWDGLPDGLVPALSWGDARPGNIIYRDGECLCLTDFENIAVAPPEMDLGYWLLFDRTMHEAVGLERLPGEPDREAQKRAYAAASGRAVGDTAYYELFGAVRYAAIVVRVMNRAVERGALPADHEIWLHNPPATALSQLLADLVGG